MIYRSTGGEVRLRALESACEKRLVYPRCLPDGGMEALRPLEIGRAHV